MADVRLNSLTFPDLPDRYVIKDYDADIAQIFEDVYNLYPRKTLPSAPIHAFADGADGIPIKAMSVAVRAVQDLHGQTSPYPSGGGKNILPLTLANIKANSTAGDWSGNKYTRRGVTFTVNTDDGGNVVSISVSGTATGGDADLNISPISTTSETILNGCPSGGGSSAYNLRITGFGNTDTGGGVTVPVNTSGTVYIRIVSGYAISGTLTFYPMLRLSSVSDATFAPYSNICPISGWDEAQIVGSGVNVWDEEWEVGTINGNTGAPSAVNDRIRSKNFIPVLGGQTYYGVAPSSVVVYAFFYDKDKNYIGLAHAERVAFTTPSNAFYMKLSPDATYGNTYRHDLSINYPSTKTTYAPYNGRIVTIVFKDAQGNPMIAYGGPLRYVSGKELEFTPTHKKITLTDASQLFAFTASAQYGAYAKVADTGDAKAVANIVGGICSSAEYVDYDHRLTNPNTYRLWSDPGQACIFVRASAEDNISTLADLYAKYANAEIMYELAQALDPITLYADAETVTEYGDNVLYCDCGDSTLTYRQDIGLLIGE